MTNYEIESNRGDYRCRTQCCKQLGITTSAVKARMFHAKVTIHRMPLSQSAAGRLGLTPGNKEEFL